MLSANSKSCCHSDNYYHQQQSAKCEQHNSSTKNANIGIYSTNDFYGTQRLQRKQKLKSDKEKQHVAMTAVVCNKNKDKKCLSKNASRVEATRPKSWSSRNAWHFKRDNEQHCKNNVCNNANSKHAKDCHQLNALKKQRTAQSVVSCCCCLLERQHGVQASADNSYCVCSKPSVNVNKMQQQQQNAITQTMPTSGSKLRITTQKQKQQQQTSTQISLKYLQTSSSGTGTSHYALQGKRSPAALMRLLLYTQLLLLCFLLHPLKATSSAATTTNYKTALRLSMVVVLGANAFAVGGAYKHTNEGLNFLANTTTIDGATTSLNAARNMQLNSNNNYNYNSNNDNLNNNYYYNNNNIKLNITPSHTLNSLSPSIDYTVLVDSSVASSNISSNASLAGNFSDIGIDDDEDAAEYIFDRTDVRIIFITIYSLVFCCCFFGNLLVILVVTLSRRLRSITNFFLANLALADFCVGLFCVMQNLSIYLIESWVFGEFLCRMYQFVQQLSYTASIFILVVICMERYFAIVHPITCKQILTAARLRMVILTVWITSAVYSTPKFVFSKTIKNVHTESGREEEICVLDRKMFNSQILDMINFGLLYVIPLIVMTVLYSKIAIALWRSSRGLSHHAVQQQQQHHENGMNMHNSMYHHQHNHQHLHQQSHHGHAHAHAHAQQQLQQQHPNNHLQQQLHSSTQQQLQQQQQPGASTAHAGPSALASSTLSRKQSSKYEKRGVSISESQFDNCKVTLDADRPVVSTCRKTSFYHHTHLQRGTSVHGGGSVSCANAGGNQRGAAGAAHMSYSTNNVLRARRGVVRMLIIFVLTFALCNLPYHARKMWQYWSRSYRGDTNFNALLTPLTFLVTYFNSGINPLLYAFLSRNFRKGMRELLLCSWKKGKGKSSSNSSMHHKRKALQTHSIPTETTHIGNDQL